MGKRAALIMGAAMLFSLSGCGSRGDENNYSAEQYAYYIKDGSFWRVRLPEGADAEPELLAAEVTEDISLNTEFRVVNGEAANASVYLFPVGQEDDMLGRMESSFYVDHGTGAVWEICRGYTEIYPAGERFLYQNLGPDSAGAEGDEEEWDAFDAYADFLENGMDLYAFVPGGEDVLLAQSANLVVPMEQGGILYTQPSGEEDDDIYYIPADGTAKDAVLLLENASLRENTVGTGAFALRPDQESGYYEIWRISEDGQVQQIFALEDRVKLFYEDYYLAATEEEDLDNGILDSDLYWYDLQTGERKLLVECAYVHVLESLTPEGKDAVQGADAASRNTGKQKEVNVLIVKEWNSDDYYLCLNGKSYPIVFPAEAGTMDSAAVDALVVGDTIYVLLSHYNENYVTEDGLIYRVELDGDAAELVLAAEGIGITPLKNAGEDGTGFWYRDYRTDPDTGQGTYYLYRDEELLCSGIVPESLMETGRDGEEHVYVLRDNNADDSGTAPDLLSVSAESGKTDTVKTAVVQAEPVGEGILMLADCAENASLYTGNLYYYDGSQLALLDEGVTMLFPHGNQYVLEVPASWEEEEDGDEDDWFEDFLTVPALPQEAMYGYAGEGNCYVNEWLDFAITFPEDAYMECYGMDMPLAGENGIGTYGHTLVGCVFPENQIFYLTIDEAWEMDLDEYAQAKIDTLQTFGYTVESDEVITLSDGKEYRCIQAVSENEGAEDIWSACCFREAEGDGETYFASMEFTWDGSQPDLLEGILSGVTAADGMGKTK